MTPRLTQMDFRYHGSTNAIFFCECNTSLAIGTTLAYLAHLIFGELGPTSGFAFGNLATFFGVHVIHVVLVSTQNQMPGINTRRIIARMPHFHAFQNGAIVEFIGEAVSANHSSVHAKKPIAATVMSASPFPAFIWAALVNLFPKALHDWAKVYVSGTSEVVVVDKAPGLAFDRALALVCALRNACLLTATAVAIAVRDFVRGIMGLHQNLQFWCQGRGRSLRRSAISIGFYSFILPYLNEWGKVGST